MLLFNTTSHVCGMDVEWPEMSLISVLVCLFSFSNLLFLCEMSMPIHLAMQNSDRSVHSFVLSSSKKMGHSFIILRPLGDIWVQIYCCKKNLSHHCWFVVGINLSTCLNFPQRLYRILPMSLTSGENLTGASSECSLSKTIYLWLSIVEINSMVGGNKIKEANGMGMESKNL